MEAETSGTHIDKTTWGICQLMPDATYRFNKIIAAETIRFIVTVAIVVYKGLKLVVYRMLTFFIQFEVLSVYTVIDVAKLTADIYNFIQNTRLP